MNPYQVLGVSSDATDEEIKKAYRTLVKKYHPDQYKGTDYEKTATEKLKEINEAYDLLKDRGKNGSYYSGSSAGSSDGGYSSGYGYYGSAGSNQQNTASFFASVRNYINMGRYNEAELLLRSNPLKNAEWFFLMGNVFWFKGWQLEAKKYYAEACRLDPTNIEYSTAFQRVNANNYNRGGYNDPRYTRTSDNMDSMCRCCTSIYCMDCCCECMGGDCIRGC